MVVMGCGEVRGQGGKEEGAGLKKPLRTDEAAKHDIAQPEDAGHSCCELSFCRPFSDVFLLD